MKHRTRRQLERAIAISALFCMSAQPTFGALLNLAQTPLFIGANIPPQVMLAISKDQQLFKKAYNDYSDLDGDGVLETTYKHSINYYGYFDPFKCYDYTNDRFEPVATTPDKYCSGKWSGNFLNWVTMTRMDAVRKLLYGGYRSTDSPSETVLERAFLPTDAHSYAKFYAGQIDQTTGQVVLNDIDRLTPFSGIPSTPPTTTSSTNFNPAYFTGGTRTWNTNTSSYQVGHQVRLTATSGSGAGVVLTGHITSISAGTSITVQVDAASGPTSGNGNAWTIENMTMVGLTFCNTTLGGPNSPYGTGQPQSGSAKARSQTNTNPPLIRAARGNYALWAANERFQCYFQEETTNPARSTTLGGTRSNGNRSGFSGLFSGAFEPTRAANGLGNIDYIVRVKVCDPSVGIGTERCKQYPNGNWKPIGLLQEYGDVDLIHFGLITGSYNKNISGGVLRKNVGTFTDEVNVSTDGRLLAPAGGGIVNTLNKLRIIGYNYNGGLYNNAWPDGDSCAFQLVNITQGQCRSWGNPMSEIYYESLRYFAGATSPTSAFNTDDSTLISGLTTASWPSSSGAVLNSNNFCAPLNVLVFNASVSTNEDDGQIPTNLSAINSSQTAVQLTQAVGANEPGAEAVTAPNQFFFGKVAGAAPSSPGFELCSAKTPNANGLGDVVGICPEGPTLGGTYHIAGLAYHARVNRIRSDIAGIPASDTRSLKVTTYGIQLATNVPTLPIKVLGDATPRAIIQPIYRLVVAAGLGGGALVDMKIVSQTVTATSSRGSVYLNWEDSEQGGDYDQDMWGILNWCMQVGGDTASCPQNGGVTNTISVTTRTIAESTGQPQGFGYVVNGTTQDGPHFHSGIENFSYNDPTNVTVTPTGFTNATGGCDTCNVTDPATTVVYRLSGNPTASNLRDPLYYAAKYGAFTDSNGNNLPDLQSEWDARRQNGVQGQDGIPDTYFLVTNPLGLEAALERAFIAILSNATASSVATNSTSLQTGTTIYQARFNANDWSGQLLAFPVNPDGTIATTPLWDSGQVINTQDFNAGRVILTYNTDPAVRDGVAFRWPTNPGSPGPTDIPAALVNYLDTAPGTGTNDGRGQQRLNYLRGDPSQEGATVTSFRQRPTSKLGDIVNSNPAFVGAPNAGIGEAAYATFRLNYLNREPMIYVGANDGMLHGFRASDGRELLAYVPSKTHPNLNRLTSKTYVHRYYVDGSPEVADAFVNGRWRTVLVGTLGAGGQGIFALDVTDPTQFTEANAAGIVLWEFNDTDDADLGYVPGSAVIHKMANGRWAAIVSGGYNSSEGDGTPGSGRAVIFVIFLDGPSGPLRTWVPGVDYVKIDSGIGTPGNPNGFAPPFAADVNADGVVDFLYAGTLTGEMVKVDVRSSNVADWTLATRRVVLFSARDGSNNAQPITMPAEGTLHPTGQGFMIVFGTGKYLETSDPNAPYRTQTFYGIWDKNDSPTISGQTVVSGRNQLLQQTINDVVVGTNTFRVVSNNMPDWSTDTTPPGANDSPPKHMGWYMDFPNSATTGERSVFRAILTAGRLIFTTLVPSTQTCLFGGTSFLMVVDPATGARIDAAVLDVDANGQLNTQDQINYGGTTVYASGVQSTIGITPTPTIVKAYGAAGGGSGGGNVIFGTGGPLVAGSGFLMAYALAAGSSGGNASTMIGLGASGGRVSWRELHAD